jgi:toxin CptA
MTDLRALEARLENWAAAQRSIGSARPDIGSIEGRYRKHSPEACSDPRIDLADAHIVNEAWKRCVPLEKEILRMHYVWRAHSSFICRQMRMKQGKGHTHVWEFALAHAHRAIAIRIAIEEQVELVPA